MKAIVYYGRQDVRYEEFPDPEVPRPREVVLKVRSAGLCHTDVNEYLHGPVFIAQTPHPRTGRSIPLVIGHEFSGQVVEIGSDVRGTKVGDRVAVNSVDSCGKCFYCIRGRRALCRDAAYVGFSRDGGFAEYAAVPEECCHPLPPSVSDEAGALAEPFAVALHGLSQSGLRVGDRAVVVGAGTIGMCMLQILRVGGAEHVFVVEKSEAKREIAEQLGASAVISPDRTDPAKVVRDLTDGLGADIAFECVGSADSLRTAIECARGDGTVCVLGVFPGPLEFNWNDVLAREQKVLTSLAYADEFPVVISMLADARLKAEPLITGYLPLSQLVELGLKRYGAAGATNIKTVVRVWA